MTSRSASLGRSFLYVVALPALLVLIWWAAATRGEVSFYAPVPGSLWETSRELWTGPAFANDLVPSVVLLSIGLVATAIVGVGVGVLIGTTRWLRQLLEPLLEFFRAIPPPVLVPLFILLGGISDQTKVVVILSGSVWPVLLNTIEGVRAVDLTLSETCRTFGIGKLPRLQYLVLPSASPQILTGIRQSMSIGLIMLVVSEIFGGTSGLGYLIVSFQHSYSIPEMWSSVFVLGFVGLGLSGVSRLLERFFLGWYEGMRKMERNT